MARTASVRSGASRPRRLAKKWIPATAAALAVACGMSVAAPTGTSAAQPVTLAGHDFVTRPDLHPPEMEVTTPATGVGEGSILTAPIPPVAMGVGERLKSSGQAGALITDNAGQPVWFKPDEPGAAIMNFQVQKYQDKPVLTWWEGKVIVPPGYGNGAGVILDQAYNEVARVRTGNGVNADIHDFQITPQNTALLVGYQEVPQDLSSVGGPENGKVFECIVQEVDIATGEVLFDWRSLDHIGLEESYLPVPADPNVTWDYIHINSVDVDGAGNLLVSGRSTHTVYQINRETGAINWRLNGKKSDIRMAKDAVFQWQHDARRLPNGTISIFDNGAEARPRSRGLVLQVDETARTATMVRSDYRPAEIVSLNMGNYQLLPNGNGFLGWGGSPGVTEIGPDHTVRYAARFTDGMTSYRSFRAPWVGLPQDTPAVVADPGSDDTTSVYVSWNGATQVTAWRVLAGANPESLSPVVDAPRAGFETRIDAPGSHEYVKVEALDAQGKIIGVSEPVQVDK